MFKQAIFFIAAILLFSSYLAAQSKNSLEGKIIDSLSKIPVEYATITLTAANTGKVVNGAITDSLGSFKLDNIAPGLYKLSLESIGYKQKFLNSIRIQKNRTTQNLGTLLLAKNENTLKDVTVTAQTKLIENRIDKIV